jgi:hypothetical protein
MKRVIVMAALVGAAASSTAFGQAGTGFTISDGNTFFTGGDTPTTAASGTSVSADFRTTGAAGTDHLFGNWWYYRMEGVDTREFRFASQTGATVVAGNTATRSFTFPSFSAVLTYQVNATGVDSGMVTETLVITPATSGFLNIFNYADFFISGQDANDTADVASGAGMSLRDTVTNTVLNFGAVPAATNFQVGPFGAVTTLMGNAVGDNLTNINSTVPAGSDIGGAFQWRLEVVQGQSITIQERFVVPTPGALALLGLGGLAAARRRR